MPVPVRALLGLLTLAFAGCSSMSDAPAVCRCPALRQDALIHLSCVPTQPPVVSTTGVCSLCPPALPNGSTPDGSTCRGPLNSDDILLITRGAGACHVEVRFGSGPASSIDIDFQSEWRPCGSDPHGCGESFVPFNANGSGLTLAAPSCAAEPDAG